MKKFTLAFARDDQLASLDVALETRVLVRILDLLLLLDQASVLERESALKSISKLNSLSESFLPSSRGRPGWSPRTPCRCRTQSR
jgi:hypothetical protein